MKSKKLSRLKRAKRARVRISKSGKDRLCVHRTANHVYAQIISNEGGRVIASASTLEPGFKGEATGNIGAAEKVGQLIAARGLGAGVSEVAFDRAGFKYHGRVEALAKHARSGGLVF